MQAAKDVPEHASALHVALHPLVIVNIADHSTRDGLARPPKARTIGCLLGDQTTRRIDIHTSVELMLKPDGTLDVAFLRERRDALLQVFPEHDVVGWYTTGKGLAPGDLENIHKHVLTFNEGALALVMDTKPERGTTQLPVYIFETHVDQQQKASLRRVGYTVESEEAERVGIEAAMRVDFNADKNQTLVPAADRLRTALVMLRSRVRVVVAYLKAVQAKQVQPDYGLLRRIAAMARAMPDPEASPGLRAAISADSEDALAVALLGIVAKGTTGLHKLLLDVTDAVSAMEASSMAGGKGKRGRHGAGFMEEMMAGGMGGMGGMGFM